MALPGIAEFTPDFFDDSSRAWMENKVKHGASVLYRCEYIHTNQKRCHKPCEYKGTSVQQYCKKHKHAPSTRILTLRSREIRMDTY